MPLRAELLMARQPRERLRYLAELARHALEANAGGRAAGCGLLLHVHGVRLSGLDELAPPLVAVQLLRGKHLAAEFARQLHPVVVRGRLGVARPSRRPRPLASSGGRRGRLCLVVRIAVALEHQGSTPARATGAAGGAPIRRLRLRLFSWRAPCRRAAPAGPATEDGAGGGRHLVFVSGAEGLWRAARHVEAVDALALQGRAERPRRACLPRGASTAPRATATPLPAPLVPGRQRRGGRLGRRPPLASGST